MHRKNQGTDAETLRSEACQLRVSRTIPRPFSPLMMQENKVPPWLQIKHWWRECGGGQPCWCLFIIISSPSADSISTSETPSSIYPPNGYCSTFPWLQLASRHFCTSILLIPSSPGRCSLQDAVDPAGVRCRQRSKSLQRVPLRPSGGLSLRHVCLFGRSSDGIHKRMRVVDGANTSKSPAAFFLPRPPTLQHGVKGLTCVSDSLLLKRVWFGVTQINVIAAKSFGTGGKFSPFWFVWCKRHEALEKERSENVWLVWNKQNLEEQTLTGAYNLKKRYVMSISNDLCSCL